MFVEVQEGSGDYQVNGTVSEDDIISMSAKILESKMLGSIFLDSAETTKRFLKHKMENLEHEVFSVLYLNNRHRVIAYEELFRGTIDGASVYSREVVKAVLAKNAQAVIFCHNHPSGDANQSLADEKITIRLKDALNLIDVRVLDHLIVGQSEIVSLAERGFI